jgi:hypothetical protein
MEAVCKGTTTSGRPCRARAVTDGLCSIHSDPERAAELGRKSGVARRRGAAGLTPADVPVPQTAADVRLLLGKTLSELSSGRLDARTASAVAYVGGVFLKAVEVADLEDRLRRLEENSAKFGQPY